MHYSPLRYPGGKNKLSVFIAHLCAENNIRDYYIEPYSGGASVALYLLFEKYVNNIIINDKDKSIYAFWFSILNFNDEFCALIRDTPLTIEEWKKQKEIQKNKESVDILKLGFSTFYLNRTNRSGIINAGVIGGLEQKGNYLMDCRFNKTDLINRIKLIGSRNENITLTNKDAVVLIDEINHDDKFNNCLLYLDPPYYNKGNTLYMNHYLPNDHKLVSNRIKEIKKINWVVSYDNVSEIKSLYGDFRNKEFSFTHTAYEAREGKEILFFSDFLNLPTLESWNPLFFKKKKSNKPIRYIEEI